jgi:molecular chaperone HscB
MSHPDPFELLGIDARFDLDPSQLEKRHRDLSRALHPDRYVGSPAAERRQALNKAIEVNEAWRVLRDPIQRAEALCARLEMPIDSSSYPPARPEFLMEMMELREALAEAKAAGDLSAVEKLRGSVEEKEATCLSDLEAAFAKLETAKLTGLPPEGLVTRLSELRYFRRFLEEARAIEDELL